MCSEINNSFTNMENTSNISTPKRRRLGTHRIIRKILEPIAKENVSEIVGHDSSSHAIYKFNELLPLERGRGLASPLPCNQVEYLHKSAQHTCDDVTTSCSPKFSQCAVSQSIEWENWDSPIVTGQKNISGNQDLSDDMFNSVIEPPQTYVNNDLRNDFVHIPKEYKKKIETVFEDVNKTICDNSIEQETIESCISFETSNLFTLEIKGNNNGVITQKENAKENNVCLNSEDFYGLPPATKTLFKMYRNIDKLYDWQEECLNLKAIKEHRNLIYALPTSGGKTLVAEILMMREILKYRRNTLLILPFVAIVQEKIWGLSPFAIQLEFLVEEYAAGKGLLPPKKRRKKNSIYVATIEKGLALLRSLIELQRLNELGLIVVDELHLIGERSRGATLETLLSTVIFANQGIQIVGMSATIGNLHEIAKFMNAEIYEQTFRPVELVEYVKLGNTLHKLKSLTNGIEVTPIRELSYDYSAMAMELDPDWLGGLVSEVVPNSSCLIFCPTKNSCENVAALLCKLQRKEMMSHQSETRATLSAALRSEGDSELARCVLFGVAYHHAGLAADERRLLEDAFKCGVISVLCCTSTLAAGVNLPARRVIVRAPFIGRDFISLGAYRQMVGRAGRAGVCESGESIIVCGEREWPRLRSVLEAGLAPVRSALAGSALRSLLLSAVALRLASTRLDMQRLVACTLLHAQSDSLRCHNGDTTRAVFVKLVRSVKNKAAMPSEIRRKLFLNVCIKDMCDEALRSLIQCGALKVSPMTHIGEPRSNSDAIDCFVYNDSTFSVSQLGDAAIKGCMEVEAARIVREEALLAARGLVVLGALHLLFLVAPLDPPMRLDVHTFYKLYSDLDEEGRTTAKALNITHATAVQMMTGKQITTVSERVLKKFYVSLLLRDLWNQIPTAEVALKYGLSRGAVQGLMTAAAATAAATLRVSEALPELWPLRALLAELAPRLQHCAAPHLHALMDLPGVKKARAMQLVRAGYRTVEDVARASPAALAAAIQHLSWTAAHQLVSASKMALIEKVENLRAEAEEVMSQLNL